MIFCIVLRLFICCSEVIYLLSHIFIKSFLCLMYHMTGFYSFPHPISQILDIAPRSSNLGAISKIQPRDFQIQPPKLAPWIFGEKSRPGHSPSKWYIYWIYGVFSCYIQQYSPSTSDFFVLGLRPRTKKYLGIGTILLDIVLKHTVYPLHIHI